MRRTSIVLSLFLFSLPQYLRAQCEKGQDNRSDNNPGVLITDVVINGTRAISTSELAEITNQLAGKCFNDDDEELSERLRMLFQEEGYFGVEVRHVTVKADDTLGHPKTVVLEADVVDGPQYKLGVLEITGNHAFTAEQLRAEFPLKNGELFKRGKVASGMESVWKLYRTEGYLDFVAIPATDLRPDATVALHLKVIEGSQYHMGKLVVLAQKDLADKLAFRWEMSEGAVYDDSYIDAYVDANRSFLPDAFTRSGVNLILDCPNRSVDVRLEVDPTIAAAHPPRKSVACESKPEQRK